MPEPKLIHAPWTEGQVDALSAYQKGPFHLYTCGPCRDADPSFPMVNQHALLATPEGWRCPTCDYQQDWAAESSLNFGLRESNA